MKKALILLFALSLVLALPVTAFAQDGTQTEATADPLLVVVISLLIGLTVGLTATLLMKRSMSTVRKQKRADSYVKDDSFSLTESRDLFLYSTVTRVRINNSKN